MVLDGDGPGYVWRKPHGAAKKDFNDMSIADQFIELRKRAVSDDERYNDKPKEIDPQLLGFNEAIKQGGGSYFCERTGTIKTYSLGGTSLRSESLKARTKKDFGQVDTEYLGRLLGEIRKQAEKIRPNKSKLTNLCNKLDREASAIASESMEVVRAKDDLLTKYRALQEVNKRHVTEKNQLGSKNNIYKRELAILNTQKTELKHKLRCFEEDEEGLKVRSIMRNAMGRINERI